MRTIARLSVFALGSFVTLVNIGVASAAEVSLSKAAELSLHRLERLVILKKIDASFQTKTKEIRIERIAHSAESDPSFLATIYQFPGADGSRKGLSVTMDGQGKAIKNGVLEGAEAVGSAQWPDKDATTLCEFALHYVEDTVTRPELLEYNQNLSVLSLSQEAAPDGSPIAVVDLKASPEKPSLKIKMKADGTVISAALTEVAQ